VATVRDANNNPVRGKLVAFTNPTDPSGGSVDPPTAITDDSGRATSTFIAGPVPTAPSAVVLKAIVLGTAFESTSNVSVSRSDLFVRIGRASDLEVPNTTFYTFEYGILVTDSTGNPINNATVQIRLTPTRYREGTMAVFTDAAGVKSWRINPSTSTSPPFKDWTASEDTNKDGICQSGEDLSGDGVLTPGNVASVTSSVQTKSDGTAVAKITYAKQAALWTQVLIEATVKVGGTEGTASAEFELLALASDLTKTDSIPAMYISPSYSGKLVARPTCP
jgi:hypothetical protein